MASPAEFFYSLPPVTRFYGAACLVTTVLSQFGFISPMSLHFTPQLVFGKLQLWRLITNFFFLGLFSPAFAVQLITLARYGVQLERTFLQRGQYIWMKLLAVIMLLGISTIVQGSFGSMRMVFMGSQLVFMILYLWSREFPNVGVSILGLVTIQGFYLPWAMLFIHAIFGQSIFEDFMGIVVGHIYYFFTVLYPRTGGRDFLRVPQSFLNILQNWGILDRVPGQAQRTQARQAAQSGQASQAGPAPQPSSANGTAFRGRSYRLDRD